jgi:hypothetical protein
MKILSTLAAYLDRKQRADRKRMAWKRYFSTGQW